MSLSLKEARTRKGITMSFVARYLNVDRTTVFKWEQTNYIPKSEYIPKICDLYGVTADDLIFLRSNSAKSETEEGVTDAQS